VTGKREVIRQVEVLSFRIATTGPQTVEALVA
jgi:hypothetical protein